MNIKNLTLCDNSQQYNGKLFIVRTFNDIILPSVLHRIPEMTIVGKIEFCNHETGKHQFHITQMRKILFLMKSDL